MNYYVVTELNQKSKKGTHVSTILSINTAIAHQSQKLSILFLCINSNCQKIQQHPIPLGLTYNLPFQYMSVFEKTRIYFSHFQYEDHVKLNQYKNFLQYRYNIIDSWFLWLKVVKILFQCILIHFQCIPKTCRFRLRE